jgi:hypothetical protein
MNDETSHEKHAAKTQLRSFIIFVINRSMDQVVVNEVSALTYSSRSDPQRRYESACYQPQKMRIFSIYLEEPGQGGHRINLEEPGQGGQPT